MEDEERAAQREQRERVRERKKAAKKAWRTLRPVVIFLLSLAICFVMISLGFNFVIRHFFMPVDSGDATPVVITINSGSGASSIAKKLYEAGGVDDDGNLIAPGLITSKTVFKIYVDFTGKSNKLKAGTYVLSRNMDVSEIVDVICEGNAPRTTLKLTVTEGMTVEQIADKLVQLGVFASPDKFLALCKTGEEFTDYSFVAAIGDLKEGRRYALEGYLFPDTYEIYSDESEKSIINRMLYRFSEIMNDENIARAKELDMSVDDVVKMASMIEKEAKIKADFARVSAVFHLRLEDNMKLQSDATLSYALNTTGYVAFTTEQLSDDSPYNTYAYQGLPVGAICNPGAVAIQAVLHPDEQMMADGYLYFCLTDRETGALVFAVTLEEHQANVAQFKPYW